MQVIPITATVRVEIAVPSHCADDPGDIEQIKQSVLSWFVDIAPKHIGATLPNARGCEIHVWEPTPVEAVKPEADEKRQVEEQSKLLRQCS